MLEEHSRLLAVLERLVGATLSRVRIGAGEIFLEFEQPDGVWKLGTGGSQWALVEGDQPLVEYLDDEREIDRFDVAVGRRVIGIDQSYDGSRLQVDLDEKSAFFIVKSPDDIAPNLPVFELFTPGHRMVVLHRDGSLDDVPSDVPIRDLVASGSLRHWPSDTSE
jgi:hypothetical protein